MRHPKSSDTPPAHHSAPAGTSDKAAEQIAEFAPVQEQRVLDFIRSRGTYGATDDEGEVALAMLAQSYTPRRGRLADRGLVVATARRRPTRTGRTACVWMAVEAGDACEASRKGAQS